MKSFNYFFSLVLIIIIAHTTLLTTFIDNNNDRSTNVKIVASQQPFRAPLFEKEETGALSFSSPKIEKEVPQEIIKMEARYTKRELLLLSKIIQAEAGSSWLSDMHQLLVGNVVLNRVNSKHFPNTIEEVIFQKGQYSPTFDKERWHSIIPSERAIKNARLLLEGLRVAPPNVVFQAEFVQGRKIYKKIKDKYLGTTYFCVY